MQESIKQEDLIIPEDYDIIGAWDNEINRNEREDITMGFKRDNKNIIGYMVVNKSQKLSCIGDGVTSNGTDEPRTMLKIDGLFGEGMYFYEYNYRYALDFAKSQKLDIVGAVLSPKKVLDFTDGSVISILDVNKQQFEQYIQSLKQKYISKISRLKDQNSETYKNYIDVLNRLNQNQCTSELVTFLNELSRKDSSYRFDSIRYIAGIGNYYGIAQYQSTILYVKNQGCVVEYFNPLNEYAMNSIQRRYTNNRRGTTRK